MCDADRGVDRKGREWDVRTKDTAQCRSDLPGVCNALGMIPNQYKWIITSV